MKKIVCLLGSPRVDGNSELLAKKFIDTAKSLGAQTEIFRLNKMNYKGCQACMACKNKLENCALKDDLSPVLDKVKEADVLLLVSPVYYGNITSQLKGFIDRTYCYLKPGYVDNIKESCRLKPGKTGVFILTQGYPDESVFADVFKNYANFLKWYGFKDVHEIRAAGVNNKGDVLSKKEIIKKAEDLAKSIMVEV